MRENREITRTRKLSPRGQGRGGRREISQLLSWRRRSPKGEGGLPLFHTQCREREKKSIKKRENFRAERDLRRGSLRQLNWREERKRCFYL